MSEVESKIEPDSGEGVSGKAEPEDDMRAESLRQGLKSYALIEDDHEILDASGNENSILENNNFGPVVAVVGRPNVGKSALVNRILGRRQAVVQDLPGVTRDRVSYRAEWNTKLFSLLDTGGWEPDAQGLAESVAAQAEIAIDLADIILFVVDMTVGITGVDERVVRLLRSVGKPVILVANKVDDPRRAPEASVFWGLGLGEPWPVSSLHGTGVADLLDYVLTRFPKRSPAEPLDSKPPPRVALLGRPNVGKSSLLNKAAGYERAVVSELAGTTRDPVDELVTISGEQLNFIDTAGIRKRINLQRGADFYSSLRTAAALERAEVAIVLLDVSESISDQDLRIIDLVVESGRSMILAYNKWDLLDDERRKYLEREIRQDLAHVSWAPRVNISAATGRHLEKLVTAIQKALSSWEKRVPTGKLNSFISELVASNPHPVRGGRQPRILYGTQAAKCPPTFVLFTSGFLEPQYRRFIERRMRELWGFEGSPIVINMRVRERRGKGK